MIYDQSNRPIRVIGAMMDMTPLRRLERRLVQSERLEAVGRLAGGVAHDFNNLLTAILGYTSALKGSWVRTQPHGPRISSKRARRQPGGRPDAAAVGVQPPPASSAELLHLDKVFAEVDNLVRRLIGEHIAIQVKRVPDLGCVQADKGQLTQVILNLCINARDAMPHGGMLKIETANVDLDSMQATPVGVAAGRYVLLAVTDTGEGMDAETQQRIFEPFFTTKPMGQGTGLGLATVYGIVKQSGGSISVDSDVGRGSTFRVDLPRTECSESAVVERPAVVARDRGMETILTVEDDLAVRDIVARTLAGAWQYGADGAEPRGGVADFTRAEGDPSGVDRRRDARHGWHATRERLTACTPKPKFSTCPAMRTTWSHYRACSPRGTPSWRSQ